MNYEIIVRPEAEGDLKEAYYWYEEQNPGLGLEFLRCVDAAVDILKRNPKIYQKIYKI